MKLKIWFAGFFLFLVLINLINAEMLVSNASVQYEPRILDEFNKLSGTNEKFVDLIIYLKNSSDADSLISNFSSDKIGRVINRHLSNMIGIQMTKGAFLKLIQDTRVESVYYNAPVDLLEGNVKENSSKIIFVSLFILIILIFIIIYLVKQKRKNAKKKRFL
jgi:hypothetical protein